MVRKRLVLSNVQQTQLLHVMPSQGVIARLFSPVARYTRFVLFGRGFLWLMIAGIIVMMIVIANRGDETNGARLVFSSIKQVGDMQNVMMNPHYQGLDNKNSPYTVIADQATQQDADTVLLDNIKADMASRDNKWLALHAGSGELKIKDKMLSLSKNVDMFYDGGYEFRTEAALVDINRGEAWGHDPVEGQGPLGTLKADGFSVEKRGELIRFNGSVRVVLYRE